MKLRWGIRRWWNKKYLQKKKKNNREHIYKVANIWIDWNAFLFCPYIDMFIIFHTRTRKPLRGETERRWSLFRGLPFRPLQIALCGVFFRHIFSNQRQAVYRDCVGIIAEVWHNTHTHTYTHSPHSVIRKKCSVVYIVQTISFREWTTHTICVLSPEKKNNEKSLYLQKNALNLHFGT